MRNAIVCCLLLQLFRPGGTALAQGYDAHWIFGDGYHIEFVDGEPQVLPYVEGYYGKEGASCISDTSGSLLFYCNTQKVWNRDFELLMNSDSINSRDDLQGSSKTNGSLFLPYPGDSLDRYFALFIMNEDDNRLYYNLIDRELDGGLGGVVPGQKNIRISPGPIGEQLTAVKHANGRDWWIVGNSGYPESDQLFTIMFTNEGFEAYSIFPAIVSSTYIGEMSLSESGQYLAHISRQNIGVHFVCLYSFDRCTGQLAFIDTANSLTGSNEFYGLAFAPTEEILYVSTERNHSLIQFDFSLGVLESELLFRLDAPDVWPFENRCGQLEMGPDGKIYMVMKRGLGDPDISLPIFDEYLAAVNYPDMAGLSCEFDTFAIYLNGRMNRTFSLPNFANYDLGPLVGSPCDTLSPQDTTQTGIPSIQIPALPFSISPTIGNGWFIMEGPHSGWAIVYDLYGREISREWHEERTAFDLTNQPAGVYLVVLRTDDGSQSLPQKIIRQ